MIKAEVRYTSLHMKALFAVEDKKRRPVRIAVLSLVAAACIIYTCIAVFLIVAGEKFNSGCFVWSFMAVILWTFFIRRLLKNRRFFREMDTMKPVKELRCFSFDDTTFSMTAAREGFSVDRKISYTELASAAETEEFFFITIEKGKTCIIGKSEFTEGTPEELRTLLTEKLGDKFRRQD